MPNVPDNENDGAIQRLVNAIDRQTDAIGTLDFHIQGWVSSTSELTQAINNLGSDHNALAALIAEAMQQAPAGSSLGRIAVELRQKMNFHTWRNPL